MPDFSRRKVASELMDDPAVPLEEIRGALEQLEQINRWLNGYPPSMNGIRQLLPRSCKKFSLLDVGTGGGGLPRRLVNWARQRGLQATIRGIDTLPACIQYAREKSQDTGEIEYQVSDFHDFTGEEQFDVVHGSLFLHHLDGKAASHALKKMHSLSRRGVVINDLHRHPLAYHSIRVLSRLFWRNRLIQNDGPLSVLRAFRRDDFDSMLAGLDAASPVIRWYWGFRWQVVIPKGQAP